MADIGKRDLYALLGVGPTATPALLRAAYRERVRARPGPSLLADLTAAYEVLSNPGQREVYDAARKAAPRRAPPRSTTGSSPAAVRAPRARDSGALPIPAPAPVRPTSGALSRAPDASSSRPPAASPGSWPPVATLLPTHAYDPDGATYELEARLSAEEAREGSVLTLSLPRGEPCPACASRGALAVRGCASCRGSGLALDPRPVEVRLPGGLIEGERVMVALDRLGIPGASLGVRVRLRGGR